MYEDGGDADCAMVFCSSKNASSSPWPSKSVPDEGGSEYLLERGGKGGEEVKKKGRCRIFFRPGILESYVPEVAVAGGWRLPLLGGLVLVTVLLVRSEGRRSERRWRCVVSGRKR